MWVVNIFWHVPTETEEEESMWDEYLIKHKSCFGILSPRVWRVVLVLWRLVTVQFCMPFGCSPYSFVCRFLQSRVWTVSVASLARG